MQSRLTKRLVLIAWCLAAACALLVVLIAALPRAGAADSSARRDHTAVFGRSVEGRPLKLIKVGDPDARRRALVVGQIHGDEQQGRRVVDRVRRRFAHVKGVALWLIDTVNPDGAAHGTRTNAHGVDLNRNFGVHWRSSEPPGSGYYQGPKPYSEPETRAVRKLVKRIEPDVSIWLHQPWGQVLAPSHGPARLEKRYSRISGVPLNRGRGEHLPGTAIRWQNHSVGGTAFVVELGPNDLTAHQLERNAKAAITVAAGHKVRTRR